MYIQKLETWILVVVTLISSSILVLIEITTVDVLRELLPYSWVSLWCIHTLIVGTLLASVDYLMINNIDWATYGLGVVGLTFSMILPMIFAIMQVQNEYVLNLARTIAPDSLTIPTLYFISWVVQAVLTLGIVSLARKASKT